MFRRALFLLVVFFAATAARAQEPPPSAADQAAQVRALLDRIDRLEKRVAELEAKEGVPIAAAAPAPAPAISPVPTQPAPAAAAPAEPVQPQAAPHSHDMAPVQQEIAAQQAELHYPNLQIRGFGDVNFASTDQPNTNSGFSLGQFDLHLASSLSRKVTYFGEITLTATPTNYNIELERSIIRYDYDDYFKMSFGRYHTPIGYWNTAFHHGAWLETTITRPESVKIGGTFIPLHFVGLLAEGNIPSGGAGLGYSFGVGNGRGTTISRPGDAGDNNNNRAWVANLYARPSGLYGLQMGFSLYRDKITLSNGLNYREWITSAYAVYTKETPEILAEFYNVNHRQVDTDLSSNSQAFYVQVAYRLPWLERTLKPYYRFEYIHTPLSEQVFANMDLVESTLGLRYDITNYAAFKAEFRRADRQSPISPVPVVNGLFLQTSFTF